MHTCTSWKRRSRALAVEEKRHNDITEINHQLCEKIEDVVNIGECAYCDKVYVGKSCFGYYGVCEMCGVEMCEECAIKKAGARLCDCGTWMCGQCMDEDHSCETNDDTE